MAIVALTTSPTFARKVSQHHSKRAAPDHHWTTKIRPIRVASHAIPPTSRSIERSEAFAERG
jgi:hypothetical protein